MMTTPISVQNGYWTTAQYVCLKIQLLISTLLVGGLNVMHCLKVQGEAMNS